MWFDGLTLNRQVVGSIPTASTMHNPLRFNTGVSPLRRLIFTIVRDNVGTLTCRARQLPLP